MEDVKQLIFNIEQKLLRINALRVEDQKKIDGLTMKSDELQKTISEQKNTIIELENKIKILKITKSLEKGKENIDAKLKINEMLREIDKCIGMLNS
jgi:hypothetical protein